MDLKVFPSVLNGSCSVPASKSVTQRAFLLALLHSGITIVKGSGKSDDEMVALQLIVKLGAQISIEQKEISIKGVAEIDYTGELNCGESGLLVRLLTMICATGKQPITLTGSGTLLKRDMSFFEKYLPTLSVAVKTKNGKIPIEICGPMLPKDIELDGSESSQYISGMLMAFAKSVTRDTTISIWNQVSKPYIDITLQMLNHFGYPVKRNGDHFKISPAIQKSQTIICEVEGDWSNGAFLLVGAAISGEAIIKGLNPDSFQGDKKLMHILAYCGVNAAVYDDHIHIFKPHFLYAFSYDATDTPDLFPPLVALACNCNGQTIIKGVHRLINKESNRATSLVNIFSALGADIYIDGDNMVIQGKQLAGGTVDSCNDHRIAMAAAIAALKCEQPVVITHAEAVNKSYPDFFKDIQVLGAKISFNE